MDVGEVLLDSIRLELIFDVVQVHWSLHGRQASLLGVATS